jgi:hypothetical protein
LVELAIPFPLANQVTDGVCVGPEPTPTRAQKLTRQFPAPEQRLEGNESIASLGPLQFCARMDVKFTCHVRRDADLVALGHGRCHGQNLAHRRSRNKAAKARRQCLMTVWQALPLKHALSFANKLIYRGKN